MHIRRTGDFDKTKSVFEIFELNLMQEGNTTNKVREFEVKGSCEYIAIHESDELSLFATTAYDSNGKG